MNIDGKAIARAIYQELQEKYAGKRAPRLGVVMGLSDPVTESFVHIKERAAIELGVELVRKEVWQGATTDDVVALVHELQASVDGIIVQLPLPENIGVDRALAAIAPEKDVDGISPNPRVLPPVAGAIREIIERHHVRVQGAQAVIVGEGRLVGKPAAVLLREMGASVTIVSRESGSLDALMNADIVVLGAGEPRLVRPEHLKEGVVVFDAGTSESSGRVVGDADPACADIASLFTPVPGGIGPVAIAIIFKNLYALSDAA